MNPELRVAIEVLQQLESKFVGYQENCEGLAAYLKQQGGEREAQCFEFGAGAWASAVRHIQEQIDTLKSTPARLPSPPP